MTEVMKNHLLSYVVNGTDNGQIMKITKITEKDAELLFEAEYVKDRYTGYLCNDSGKVFGSVKLVEKENQKNVLIRSAYKGVKDNKSYEYSQDTGFEMTDYKDKNTRMVYKTSQTTRAGLKEPVRSTYYITQTSSDNSLEDYFYNCSRPGTLDLYHAKHKIKQLQA